MTWCRFRTFWTSTRNSGSASGGNGHVLDHRHRPASIPPSDAAPAESARPIARTDSISAGSNAGRAPNASRRSCQISSTRRCSRSRTSARLIAVLLDQQHRLRLARNQQVEPHVGVAGEAQVAAVQQVAGGRPVRQNRQHRPGRLLQASRTATAPRRGMRGSGCGRQRRLGGQGQRALRADQQPGQIEMPVGQHAVEMVAAAIDRALGLMAPDQILVPAQAARPTGRSARVSADRRRRSAPSTSGSRPTSITCPSASTTCSRRTCRRVEPYFGQWLPGGVDGDHAAERGHGAVGRVGTEEAPAAAQMGVEPFVDHARLNADRLAVGAQQPVQMPREIQHESRPERFARRTRAGAPGVERDLLLGGVPDAWPRRRRCSADGRRPAA